MSDMRYQVKSSGDDARGFPADDSRILDVTPAAKLTPQTRLRASSEVCASAPPALTARGRAADCSGATLDAIARGRRLVGRFVRFADLVNRDCVAATCGR